MRAFVFFCSVTLFVCTWNCKIFESHCFFRADNWRCGLCMHGASLYMIIQMAQSVGQTGGGFIITKPIGLISPPLCFPVCLSFTGYYLFSLFGRTEWPRQSRPSRPIELWHNRCNTSMHLSQEPLIRPSCSFHQFAPAPVGFLGGMGVRQRGLLYCM